MIEGVSRIECVHGSRLLPSTLTSSDQNTFEWDDAVVGDLAAELHRLAIGLRALAGGAPELPVLGRVRFTVEDACIGEVFRPLAWIPPSGLISDVVPHHQTRLLR